MYGWRQYQNSCSKSKSALQKRIKGYYRCIESIYNSSYDSIPLSLEQKRTICCGTVAFAAREIIFYYFQYDTVIYASEQIYDLYSKGFIDISHSIGFIRKILVAFFVVIGKIQNWFKTS
jgi:hypothetical protein